MAKRVRLALELLAAGDEVKALEGLRDVSRSSPFADWLFFARGLAASRRSDDAEARANWDSLDPDRSASRIARALLAATGGTPAMGRPSRRRRRSWSGGPSSNPARPDS